MTAGVGEKTITRMMSAHRRVRMAPKVEVIHGEKLIIGEGPFWDQEAQVLYYIDLIGSTFSKYDPSTKKVTRVVLDKEGKIPIGFAVPVAGTKDKFVIGYGKKLSMLTWDGVGSDPTKLETIIEVESGIDNRFNDGKVDPKGRLWAGTMLASWLPGEPEIKRGALYSFDIHTKSVKTHLTEVGISNGLAWFMDIKTFYYVDSFKQTIDAFDYDIDNGELSNRRTVFDVVKNNIVGLPDGMTIDVEGKLWLATFGGSAIHRIDPITGTLIQSVELPASKITSAAWGGSNLDELYVTTASIGETDENPASGRLLKITGLGTSGFPSVPVKLQMAHNVEVVHDEKLSLGEGPHWDDEAKVLYYVDVFQSTIFKYDPSTAKVTRVIVDKTKSTPITWVIPIAGSKDKFTIAYGREIAVLTWDGVSTEPTNLHLIIEVDIGTENRFNDGKVDPSGRLWCGTMAEYIPGKPEQYIGGLYSLNKDGRTVKQHLRDIGISNGQAWSADHKTFYYIDSYKRAVDAFDFDIDNSAISNRRVVFDLKENNIVGIPDGMTIDKDDKLWVAVFGSSSVYQIDPENGALLQSITLPVPGITSCTWGGSNLDELYVTCASKYDEVELRYAGCLFKVTGLGTSGFPGVAAKI